MGHGGFDEQNGGALLFADRTGGSVPVTAEDLGVLMRDHTSMRLAVLNACEGARSDPADPFAGVADTLVRRGIPAVIAMQFEFSDDAAIEFAPALYRALAAGRPVDAAVGEARKAVYTVARLNGRHRSYIYAPPTLNYSTSPRTHRYRHQPVITRTHRYRHQPVITRTHRYRHQPVINSQTPRITLKSPQLM